MFWSISFSVNEQFFFFLLRIHILKPYFGMYDGDQLISYNLSKHIHICMYDIYQFAHIRTMYRKNVSFFKQIYILCAFKTRICPSFS